MFYQYHTAAISKYGGSIRTEIVEHPLSIRRWRHGIRETVFSMILNNMTAEGLPCTFTVVEICLSCLSRICRVYGTSNEFPWKYLSNIRKYPSRDASRNMSARCIQSTHSILSCHSSSLSRRLLFERLQSAVPFLEGSLSRQFIKALSYKKLFSSLPLDINIL